MEIFRKESQNRLSRGQVTEGHQPGEVVQSLEQLQDREGSPVAEGQGRRVQAEGQGWSSAHSPRGTLTVTLMS